MASAQSTKMTNGMTRSVEKVLAAISEIVKRTELAYHEAFTECDFDEFTVLVCTLRDGRIGVDWVSEHHNVLVTGPDGNGCDRRKEMRIINVAPVPVQPHNGAGTLERDIVLSQDFRNAHSDIELISAVPEVLGT